MKSERMVIGLLMTVNVFGLRQEEEKERKKEKIMRKMVRDRFRLLNCMISHK